jgi:hypothetical protein
MKKLLNMFLWFCTATLMAQVAIIALATWKGNVRRGTASQVIALLNGIDIQGERLKQMYISGRAVPTPTYEEILEAKTNAALELDNKSRSLDRYQRRLDDSQRKLEEDIKRFEQRRDEFDIELQNRKNGFESEKLKETQKIISVLSPESAQKQLGTMWQNEQKADVASIIRAMAADIQKKILAEFDTPEEQAMLAEIIREIQNGDPLNSTVDKALEQQSK